MTLFKLALFPLTDLSQGERSRTDVWAAGRDCFEDVVVLCETTGEAGVLPDGGLTMESAACCEEAKTTTVTSPYLPVGKGSTESAIFSPGEEATGGYASGMSISEGEGSDRCLVAARSGSGRMGRGDRATRVSGLRTAAMVWATAAAPDPDAGTATPDSAEPAATEPAATTGATAAAPESGTTDSAGAESSSIGAAVAAGPIGCYRNARLGDNWCRDSVTRFSGH
ncbi:hypothetical protein OS493_016894 [Desmophyllum pertusum]|uniref:Uncharacterized protein n=1 Tax=Desmophyllum pertusum TaxID=174260 RepID=A0A9X0CLW3_9CNID|nr:hypothetical protein OS493_016894 [Desmophyllum pertusum]